MLPLDNFQYVFVHELLVCSALEVDGDDIVGFVGCAKTTKRRRGSDSDSDSILSESDIDGRFPCQLNRC